MSGMRLFAGANTAKGFSSFYGHLARDSSRRVFILKGGPGTGKSTLIKKIADILESEYIVDRYHCSADVNSLDGLYIGGLDISILDGTAPHVTDPRLPGAVQEIVDLGTCWDHGELVKRRNEILNLTNSISAKYSVAYKWMITAASLADLVQVQERQPYPEKRAAAEAAEITRFLPEAVPGHNRQAFATAITGAGFVSFLSKLQSNCPVNIGLVGGNRSYNDKVLQSIRQVLTRRNIPATYLYCGLLPDYLEHIYIPGVFGLYSLHQPHMADMSTVFGPPEPEESPLQRELESAIRRAEDALAGARQLHMDLEKIYTPHVDFACVGSQRDRILRQIEGIKTRL